MTLLINSSKFLSSKFGFFNSCKLPRFLINSFPIYFKSNFSKPGFIGAIRSKINPQFYTMNIIAKWKNMILTINGRSSKSKIFYSIIKMININMINLNFGRDFTIMKHPYCSTHEKENPWFRANPKSGVSIRFFGHTNTSNSSTFLHTSTISVGFTTNKWKSYIIPYIGKMFSKPINLLHGIKYHTNNYNTKIGGTI